MAVLSGVKALSKFISDPTVGFASVVEAQLSFLCNENEVKVHLRKSRVDFDGNPTVSIPKLSNIVNPSYDFIQVVVSSFHWCGVETKCLQDYNFDTDPTNEYAGKKFVMKMSTQGTYYLQYFEIHHHFLCSLGNFCGAHLCWLMNRNHPSAKKFSV